LPSAHEPSAHKGKSEDERRDLPDGEIERRPQELVTGMPPSPTP
jgi:hypothetical protein